MSRPAATLVLLTAFASGCIAMQPRSGVAPTGDALSVETHTKRWTETHSEKVGETDHYDSQGDYAGTSEQYADKKVKKSSFHWRPMQGAVRISDEDFFRISGDIQRADAARKYRRIGTVMTVTGVLALAGGTALAIAPFIGTPPSDGQKLGMYIGGGLIGSAGAASLGFGIKRLTADGHPHSYGDALDAAKAYNDGEGAGPRAPAPPRPLGRSITVGVLSGRF